MTTQTSREKDVDPTQRRISHNIDMLLRNKGITRPELADALGFSHYNVVDQKIRGRSEWKPQHLLIVAEVLQVPVGDLYAELRLVPADGGGSPTTQVPLYFQDTLALPGVLVAA